MANYALLHETRQRLLNAEGEPVYAVGRDEFGRDRLLYDCLSLLADTCSARLWFPYDPSVKSTSIARWFADRLEHYDRYYADFSAGQKPTVLAVFERVSDLTLEEVRFGRLLSRDRKLLILAGARKHGFLRGLDPARVLRLGQPYRAAFLPENELRDLTDTPLSALPRLFASGVTHTSESSPEIALRASGDKISIDAVVSDDVHLLIADELPLASARPYVVTTRLTRAFREQLATFEALINDPNVKESAFQHYFEHHEHFLAGYDYVRVVPQVVLHRDDGSSLKPDFMLQPCRSVSGSRRLFRSWRVSTPSPQTKLNRCLKDNQGIGSLNKDTWLARTCTQQWDRRRMGDISSLSSFTKTIIER